MLLSALAENLLVLLAHDKQRAPIIRALIEPAMFGGHLKLFATRIYEYIDRYKEPPGDHLTDLMMDKLESKLGREADLYSDVTESILTSAERVNAEYVMASLETFVKRQSLRAAGVDFVKALQRDTEESLEEAEHILTSMQKTQLSVFDPGTRLSDLSKSLAFLDLQAECLPMGIPELDRRGFGPTRKELWLFIANTKAGKTHMLVHLGKMALMHHFRICHISLELSEARCVQRYYQSWFAITKRKDPIVVSRFTKDQQGVMTGVEEKKVMPKLTLSDPDIRKKLTRRISRWSQRAFDNIYVRAFPTGQLTIPQLNAYLDSLEQAQRFVPDLLIIDYPDLMKLDKGERRFALDELYKDIRGLAVARNMACAVVSQSHRAAANVKLIGVENIAEAYVKAAHADTNITYTQTKHERRWGLARLHVAAGRGDEDKITVVISQNYAMGQFVVDSVLMRSNYWDNIPDDEEQEK